ncbi:hypothetical protein B5F35_03185 [Anaeromassilibacillus sp. An200]|nr:hypothetical protein B5F35_03185 [Anaeromassilibacillus sp. An200]
MGSAPEQPQAVSFQYEKMILFAEETAPANGWGSFPAAFSRPAPACPSGRVPQGVFLWGAVRYLVELIRGVYQ